MLSRALKPGILLALTVTSAFSSVIYSNGVSNLADGANISSYVVADDFSLAASSALEGFSFASSADYDPYPQFSNLVSWAILTDVQGQPGLPLASGAGPASFADTGQQILGTEEYQLSVATPSTVLLSGNYWLALTVASAGNLAQSVYWDTTSSTHGSPAMLYSLSGWSPAVSGAYGSDLAFTLYGEQVSSTGTAPESSTLALLLLSLISLCLIHGLRRFRLKIL